MGYFSLTWLDFIPHVRALMQVIITLYQKRIWPCECGITHCSKCQCLNHQKTVIIILWCNCLITLEAKCHLYKSSDFIVHYMICMLEHINSTMQTFTWITGSIYSCLVISLHSSFKSLLYYMKMPWKKETKVNENTVNLQICMLRQYVDANGCCFILN